MITDWPEYQRVNNAIEELGRTTHSIPKIEEVLKFLTKVKGKRTRPIIALLCGKLCGGEQNDVMNFAVAIELIHAASLVHDDVVDKGTIRRSVETLHVKYSVPIAILIGDWLISKAVELVSIYDENVICEFAKLGMKMVKGEIMDIYSISEAADEEDYFECIVAKTAEIFSYSAENACKIVSDDEAAASSLFVYGKNLGIAYQLVDDLLEFLEFYDDKKSKIKSRTLPLIYEEIYGFEESIRKITNLIQKHSAISIGAMDFFEPCESKEKLLVMTQYLTKNLLHSYGNKNKKFIELIKSF